MSRAANKPLDDLANTMIKRNPVEFKDSRSHYSPGVCGQTLSENRGGELQPATYAIQLSKLIGKDSH